MLCALILYISGGTYSLKSTPNERFFEKLFMALHTTFRVFARSRRGLVDSLLDEKPGFESQARHQTEI